MFNLGQNIGTYLSRQGICDGFNVLMIDGKFAGSTIDCFVRSPFYGGVRRGTPLWVPDIGQARGPAPTSTGSLPFSPEPCASVLLWG